MAGSPKATLGRINIAECTKSTHVEVSVAMTPTCAANCKTVVVKPSTKAADAKEDGIESKAPATASCDSEGNSTPTKGLEPQFVNTSILRHIYRFSRQASNMQRNAGKRNSIQGILYLVIGDFFV